MLSSAVCPMESYGSSHLLSLQSNWHIQEQSSSQFRKTQKKDSLTISKTCQSEVSITLGSFREKGIDDLT